MAYEFAIIPAQYDVGKREVQLLVGCEDCGFHGHSFCCGDEVDEFIAQLQAISGEVFGESADPRKQKRILQQKTRSETKTMKIKMKEYNDYLNQLPDILPEVPGFW